MGTEGLRQQLIGSGLQFMDGALEDTICAVATPAGEGGIGIVRISGSGALAVAEKIVRLRSKQPLGSAPSHTLQLADIFASVASSKVSKSLEVPSSGREGPIDEALVVFMKGPRSFTAEDVVEIHAHGNGVLLGRICESCIAAGARLAYPGEFTKRAFLNGRLDLSQAEAVLDTIKAKSEAALKVAQRHLKGDLGLEVNRLRGRLVALLARVEAGIDFVEEDIVFVAREEVIETLQKTLDDLDDMLETSETGRVLREGARVVIVGRPNVGKSSLLNSLLREERAIVTAVPGTTRDLIEESVVWDGLTVTLVDTAGLRETGDVVEQEGIKRTVSARDRGDVVLHVFDADDLGQHVWADRIPSLPSNQHFVLMNKIDLMDEKRMYHALKWLRDQTGYEVLPVSAHTGEGLENLKTAIRSYLLQTSIEPNEGVVVTNVRHCTALKQARKFIHAALDSTRSGIEPEFVAVDLRAAGDALGEITGVITADDILERIFADFCIGK